MRRRYFFVAFYCVTSGVFGQSSIDSLKLLYNAANNRRDTKSVANYAGQIAWAFLGRGGYDSATYYYHKSLRASESDRRLTASNYNSLGIIYNNTGRSDSAILYYEKSLVLFLGEGDTANATIIENNLAIIYKNQGLYERALESVFSALDKLERRPPDRALASAYNTVGSVYARMGDNVNALLYYKKALQVRKDIAYEKGVAQSYNNIGETFIAMNMLDSALSNLIQSNSIKKKLNDTRGMGSTMGLIGAVLMSQKRYAEAEPYVVSAVDIKRASGERVDEAIALNHLAELRLAMGIFSGVDVLLAQAAQIIRESGALDQLQKNLELQVKLYKARRNTELALAAMEELVLVKDSLLTKEKIESLRSMQVRYETDKKEQQITLLEKDKALQQAELRSNSVWISGLVISVVLLLIIAGLVYANFRMVRASKKKVDILLRELHHRVKNNLQLLSSIFSLQSQELKDEKAIQAVKTSEGRINAMALIHRRLYKSDENRSINLRDYVEELVQYLASAYGYNEKDLRLSANLASVEIDVDKAIPLGFILNELISNSFKYAFVEHSDPELLIHLEKQDDRFCITVGDNGKGWNQNDLQGNDSFGIKMVGLFVKELRGSLELSTASGTQYKLIIPSH